jgi:hypothetical protein
MLIEIEIPGFWLGEAIEGGRVFHRVGLPGYSWNEVEPGHPELPVIPLLFAIPPGCEASVVSVELEGLVELEGISVFPLQPPTTDGAAADRPGFVPADPEAYSSSGPSPSVSCQIDNEGIWSGVPVARLAVFPIRFDASPGLLSASALIRIEVAFEGQAEPFPSIAPGIQNMHRAQLINYDDLPVPARAGFDDDGPVYILITNDENLEAVTPLVLVQHLLGNHVVVEILPNPATASQIEFAVNGNYEAGTTRFVLIAGPHDQLPSWSFGSFYGDYYFATVDADNYPDVAVGRISDTYDEIPNQVDKILSYMSHTGSPGEPSIPASAALCAHEEGYPGGYTGNKEAIKNWSYALTDIVFQTFYPPLGATAEDVENCINDGIGSVNYRGHGQNTYWQWSPGWNAGNIYSLTNTFFPIVFNVSCLNGNHPMSFNCLAESWLAAPGVGASGALGASASSYTTPNNTLDRNLYWAIYRDGTTCAGEAVDAAKIAMIAMYPSYGLTNARMYHWFGDPAQDVFNCDETGSPFGLELSGPSEIGPGTQDLSFTVTVDGSPESGVVVTASDGIGDHPDDPEGFYSQATTNASGQATLSVTAVEGDTIRVGAYKHNFAYDTIDISVGDYGIEEDEEGEDPAFTLAPPIPNPATGEIALLIGLSSPAEVLVRAYDVSGRMVETMGSAELQAGSHSLQWDLSELPSGVYMIVASSESGERLVQKLLLVRD